MSKTLWRTAAAALCLLAPGCSQPDDPVFLPRVRPGSASPPGGEFRPGLGPLPPDIPLVGDVVRPASASEDVSPLEWKPFEISEWKCSVTMPGAPQRLERPSAKYLYRLEAGHVEYSLRIDDLPPSAARPAPDQIGLLLIQSIQSRADRFAARVIESRRCFVRGMRTIRSVLMDFDLDRLYYWQHMYDPEAGRIIVLSVAGYDADPEAEAIRFFDSFQILGPPPPTHRRTPAEFLRHIASESPGPTVAASLQELTGTVAAIRVEKGEFGARHRIVELRETGGSAASAPAVLCSMDGAPWNQLSPGCRATIRGRHLGLKGGLLVNCEVVETDGEPCLSLDSRTLAQEFASDRPAARRKYEGRLLVVSGTVVSGRTTTPPGRKGGLSLDGHADQQVFCTPAPSSDIDVESISVGDHAVVLGRCAAGAAPGALLEITNCYLIETPRP